MDYLANFLDLDKIIQGAVNFSPRVIVALAIMLVFYVVYRISRIPIKAALNRAGLHAKLVQLLVDGIYRYSVFAFAVVMSLSHLGVNVGAAVAGLGVAGIAVGLAAQDSLSNTIAGFTIFWDKPFVVGDFISVHGEYGMVQDITLRSTRIRTPRNSYVVIPNKRIIDEVLENDSTHGELRLDLPIGIAYKEDTHQARQVLLEALAQLDPVLSDPAPDVVVQNCGDSSVNLVMRVWVADAAQRQGVQYTAMEAGKRALDAAGIQIPFPHLQLFWDDVEDRVVQKLGPLAGNAS